MLCFEKTVRNLHVLCSFIKIETARSGRADTGFDTLSDDVKKLARNIESQSAVLMDQSFQLTALIAQSLGKVRFFEERQHAQARRILEEAKKNLVALSEQHVNSTAALKAFSDRWDQLSRNIGEVVSSAQFHDITRQRIEHVRDALRELAERVGTAGAMLSFRKGRGKRGGWGNGLGTEQIGFVADTCEIQSAQLCRARDEFVTAVQAMIKNTRDIARTVERISDETRQLVGATGAGGCSYLSDLDGGLASLIAAVTDYVNVNRDLSAVLRQVIVTVEQMSAFVKEIEKIGIEMEMVALNASVHAAHIGEEGLALGVLADALHPLSVETSRQICAIAGTMKSIIAVSHELATGRDGGEVQEHMADRLEGMMAPLRRLDEDNLSLLARLEGMVKALAGDIDRTIDGIDVHERIGEEVSGVNAELTGIVNSMRSALPAGHRAGEGGRLQEISVRYTMDKERKIHQSVAALLRPGSLGNGRGSDGSCPSPFIPLMEGDRGRGKDERTQAVQVGTGLTGPEGLGDNVELF